MYHMTMQIYLNTPLTNAFECLAQEIIKSLEIRNMEGYYCKSSKDCVDKILSMIPENSSISWGGSMSIQECGLMTAIRRGKYNLIDRKAAKTPTEQRQMYSKIVLSDYYIMSSNAVTMDGMLVNVDDVGNRVACLIAGPSNVIVVIGRNKIVETIECAKSRISNIAAPANTQRLHKNTPCSVTGKCENCFSVDCICSQSVITRRSDIKGRIKVFLVNEILGY